MNEQFPFVLREYENGGKEKAKKAMLDADVCLLGSCSFEHHRWLRKARKTYFMETERFFRGKLSPLARFLKKVRYFSRYSLYRKNYLLCMSAYTYPDMLSFGAFRNRAFRFGYFPPTEKIDDIPLLLREKDESLIFWVSRFLELKHPEFMIELAKEIREKNLYYHIEMVGDGPERERIQKQVEEEGLQGIVSLPGSLPAPMVREKMKTAKFFCFTSDSNEGWGAVCNEAMNAGCIVIANRSIGSVPYLIEDGKNGFVYEDSFPSFLATFTRATQAHDASQIAEKAYLTIANEWNADVAAERFFAAASSLLSACPIPPYERGPFAPERSSSSVQRRRK